MAKKLSDEIRELCKVQRDAYEDNQCEYNRGLLNGIEIVKSMVTGEDPELEDHIDFWHKVWEGK